MKKNHILILGLLLLGMLYMRDQPQIFLAIAIWGIFNMGCSNELKKQWEENNPHGVLVFLMALSWIGFAIFTLITMGLLGGF